MKPIKTLTSAALLAVLPTLLALPAAAQAPEFALDHFKCWTVLEGQPANDFALLTDQFDTDPVPGQAPGPEQVLVGNPVLFCNPTVKALTSGQVTPIQNPDHHLKMYQISTHPTPVRTVLITNQFAASLPLTIYRPIFLAVPTQKDRHPDPVGLDHFKCYLAQAPATAAPNPTVVLQDQFDRPHREIVKVLRPVLLCNPVEKEHDDKITPIADEREHLVCYTFTPSSAKRTISKTRNQFGQEKLLTAYSRLLCVPSLKSIPE